MNNLPPNIAKTTQFSGSMMAGAAIQSGLPADANPEAGDPINTILPSPPHVLNNQPRNSGTKDIQFQPPQTKSIPDWAGKNKASDTVPVR